MWPSRSAYTRFCAGTEKSAAAARNESQSEARFRARIASAVGAGSRAVHASATAYPLPRSPGSSVGALAPTVANSDDTSLISGPWTVSRTRSSTSSSPRIPIVSVRTCIGTLSPSRT